MIKGFGIKSPVSGAPSYGIRTSHEYGVAKGLAEPVSPYRNLWVFGTPSPLGNADNWNAPPVLWESTDSFDLSVLPSGVSVAVALSIHRNIYYDGGHNFQVVHQWRNSRNELLFSSEYWIPDPGEGYYIPWYYVYSVVGYAPGTEGHGYGGFGENGPKHIDMYYAGLKFTTLNLTITGIPVPVPASEFRNLVGVFS